MISLAIDRESLRGSRVSVGKDTLTVTLSDGRTITCPLDWYPRLQHGTQKERDRWRWIGAGIGIHWPDLDEDISIENILQGQPSAESANSFQRWLDLRIRRKESDHVGAPIIDIEGIGPVYSAKLKSVGIETVEELLNAAVTPKARQDLADKTGISRKRILAWANRADLWRIKGIGEEYGDLLEMAGVDTVPELAQRNPANLVQALQDVQVRRKLVRRMPAQSQIAEWIEQAKQLPRVLQY